MALKNQTEEHRKYLELLAREFPTQEATVTEIINLQAIINLPKGTEHFMSDLHGEYEAFYHILNNSSGVIREKVDMLFSESMNDRDRKNLCTLIYYPKEKLDMLVEVGLMSETWAKTTLRRLLRLARIYDRGPYAHKIMDRLMQHHSVDVQWGNHDVLWMGAAAGSIPCIINVIRNNVRYNNWEILENGYGISMRDFVTFAAENYQKDESKNALVKAINVMLFKAEGQAMLRHPEFKLEDRLLFDKIDPVKGIATLPDGQYEMNTTDFPTYDPDRPYEYSPEEEKIIEDWQWDFLHSEALQKHMDFFFSHGSLYKVMNGNLMFHGGLPMNEDGTFRPVTLRGKTLKGRAYMDWVDHLAPGLLLVPVDPSRFPGDGTYHQDL